MSPKRIKKRRVALLIIISSVFVAAYAHHKLQRKSEVTGKLQDKAMNETSGIAASAISPGILYVHNDSGDSSRFFAIDDKGALKTTYNFKGLENNGLGARDCEDIAVAPGPLKNKSYIYLGDIGDNAAVRPYLTVYRFAEPKQGSAVSRTLTADHLFLQYPDGPRDAETLMADPVEKLLYIVSKRTDSVTVYTTPLNFRSGDTVVLTKRARLFFPGFPPMKWITAGSISADGSQILLKNYSKVYYWKRPAGMPVWKVMKQAPAELDYEAEKQGEAITFARDGRSYYTTSEGIYAPIYHYFVP
ncbi:hypothetical protein [Mucilaginibacter ginkgonis]|uniref:Uncharacterized protein n=1 Tax=Mucilaginibacter ginkgonis TaxID=2682091 RepID=A0A6I4INI9_9SPHI|nr:hypothetical protein [Mucilaginibacter ginkgonis]QQL48680.1 hypothetical protein GO620_010865 [Mucilaginibacter ginkgonis]